MVTILTILIRKYGNWYTNVTNNLGCELRIEHVPLGVTLFVCRDIPIICFRDSAIVM